MSNRTTRRILTASLLLSAAGLALAGPLSPPSGPVASTYKTLTEVEPRRIVNSANTPGDADSVFRISEPGSYYLENNILVQLAGRHGIEIASGGVTLDLNGFNVRTISAAPGAIRSVGAIRGVTVRNGSVTIPSGAGALPGGLDLGSASECMVESVTVLGGTQGIQVGGDSIVRNCVAALVAGNGINAGNASIITNCVARDNTNVGIDVDDAGVVQGCTATGNGTHGIGANNGSNVTDCVTRLNGSTGTPNTIYYGIAVGSGCVVARCASRGDYAGFLINLGGTVTGCNASEAVTSGFSLFGSCTALQNRAHNNASDGFILFNGGNMVDGNVATSNATGFSLGLLGVNSDNFIVRNVARGNTTDFPAGIFGNSQDAAALVTPSGGFSASAWSNFSH
jgi:hypothetical protein